MSVDAKGPGISSCKTVQLLNAVALNYPANGMTHCNKCFYDAVYIQQVIRRQHTTHWMDIGALFYAGFCAQWPGIAAAALFGRE